jgi:hypothetical protein
MGNPYITGLPWAPGPNYPSFPGKPWSLQPIGVAPGFDYFVPTQAYAPTAQQLNYMFNQRDNALLYMNRFAPDSTKLVLANSNTLAVYLGGAGWGALNAYDSVLAHGHVEVNDIVPSVLAGDIVEISVSTTMIWNGSTGIGQGNLRLEWLETGAGGTSTTPFSPASDQAYGTFTGSALDSLIPMTLLGSRTVATPGTLRLYLNGCVGAAVAAANWKLSKGVLTWRQWRPT